jgi:hypothetical protein
LKSPSYVEPLLLLQTYGLTSTKPNTCSPAMNQQWEVVLSSHRDAETLTNSRPNQPHRYLYHASNAKNVKERFTFRPLAHQGIVKYYHFCQTTKANIFRPTVLLANDVPSKSIHVTLADPHRDTLCTRTQFGTHKMLVANGGRSPGTAGGKNVAERPHCCGFLHTREFACRPHGRANTFIWKTPAHICACSTSSAR